MVRKTSADFQLWRRIILDSPWVSEIEGELRCRDYAGYLPVAYRGDSVKSEPYRCTKFARYHLKATKTRSMLTPDAVSGNYCARHLKLQIEEHEGERKRFETWFAKWHEKHG